MELTLGAAVVGQIVGVAFHGAFACHGEGGFFHGGGFGGKKQSEEGNILEEGDPGRGSDQGLFLQTADNKGVHAFGERNIQSLDGAFRKPGRTVGVEACQTGVGQSDSEVHRLLSH